MSLPTPIEVIAAQVITASGQSGTLNTSGSHLDLEIVVSAASGTTPSVTFAVQFSDDGADWASASGDTFAAVSTVGNAVAQFPAVAPFWRLTWTVSGTTPSFTVSVYQSDV